MQKNQNILKKQCKSCLETLNVSNFYKSYNKYDADGKLNICKKCLKDSIDYNDISTVKEVLMQINRPFIHSLWLSSEEEAKAKNKDQFGLYMKTLGLSKFKELLWKDSDENNISEHKKTEPEQILEVNDSNNETKVESTAIETQNKLDVIRMVGYDPFEFENENDKRHLYNKLVDFLDEGTLEDGFKLPTVIEIVKTFNQLDKINNTISSLSSDPTSFLQNAGTVKSLIESKDKLYKSVLALAKDNGISVNHNNTKSKGTGTLSGIIKQLHEKGIRSAEINVYDIDTAEGMKQVADISNRSIFEQLMLNESDLYDMVKEQREMIQKLTQQNEQLEEENRLLKISMGT